MCRAILDVPFLFSDSKQKEGVALGEDQLTNDTIIDLQLSFGDWEAIHSVLVEYLEQNPSKETYIGESDTTPMGLRRLEQKINQYLEFASTELF